MGRRLPETLVGFDPGKATLTLQRKGCAVHTREAAEGATEEVRVKQVAFPPEEQCGVND